MGDFVLTIIAGMESEPVTVSEKNHQPWITSPTVQDVHLNSIYNTTKIHTHTVWSSLSCRGVSGNSEQGGGPCYSPDGRAGETWSGDG